MRTLSIVILCIVAAVVYGIIHDQITARICVEYFTIGHPPIFETESPTLLGIGWGILATWWVGLIIGLPLAMAARMGRRPRLTTQDLVVPLLILLLIMGAFAAIAGATGARLARSGAMVLSGPMASAVPPEKHVGFICDIWAHSASYLFGAVGGIILIAHTWRRRRKSTRADAASFPTQQKVRGPDH